VKRTGRKRPLRIARRRRFRPFRLTRRMPGERRIGLEVLIGALVGLVLAYFAGKEQDACEADGGKMVKHTFTTRCEYPDVPAQPVPDATTVPSVLQTRDPQADSTLRHPVSPPAGETP
jgi:hypothetical protein